MGLLETFFSSENFIFLNEKEIKHNPQKKRKILEEEGHENEDPRKKMEERNSDCS